MDIGYQVTRRATGGAPEQIACTRHDDCGWTFTSRTARRDDDPILMAQHAQHVRNAEPTPSAFGHIRAKRAAEPVKRK